MKPNPFKFGTVVDDQYFTDRTEEIKIVNSVLNSENHLIVISPRRYGKTSLIYKVVKESGRPFIFIDLQLITTVNDLASQILKRINRIYPFEKLKRLIKNFKFIPAVSVNPLTNEIEVSFNPVSSSDVILSDVLEMVERISTKRNKLIIVFDEFQEIIRIDKNLDKKLRSIFQHQKKVNYILSGSQESLMKEIFENKKSPFYHFGYLLSLKKIQEEDFFDYLNRNFSLISKNSDEVCKKILEFTKGHPYYTQQFAFYVWEEIVNKRFESIDKVVKKIVQSHDNDFERLWGMLTKTEMKVMISLAESNDSPLKDEIRTKYNLGATSTVFSALKKLILHGFVLKTSGGYEIEDPFFGEWIKNKRIG